jgi:hypothetical protein
VNIRGFERLAPDQAAYLRANVLCRNVHQMLMLTPLPTALLTATPTPSYPLVPIARGEFIVRFSERFLLGLTRAPFWGAP